MVAAHRDTPSLLTVLAGLTLARLATIVPIESVIYPVVLCRESLIFEASGGMAFCAEPSAAARKRGVDERFGRHSGIE
jgi:hypothetical protein